MAEYQAHCESDPEDENHNHKKLSDNASVDSGYTSQTKSSTGSDAQKSRTVKPSSTTSKPPSPTKKVSSTASSPTKLPATSSKVPPPKINTKIPSDHAAPQTLPGTTSPPFFQQSYRSASAAPSSAHPNHYPPSSYFPQPQHPYHIPDAWSAMQSAQYIQQIPQYRYPDQERAYTMRPPSQYMPYEQYNNQAGMYNAPQVNPYPVGSNHHDTRPVVSHHASYPSVQSSGELAAQMARTNLDTSGQASYTKPHKQRPANPRVETAPASSLLRRTTSSARRSRPAVVEPLISHSNGRAVSAAVESEYCDCDQCKAERRAHRKMRRDELAAQGERARQEAMYHAETARQVRPQITYGEPETRSRRSLSTSANNREYIISGPRNYKKYYREADLDLHDAQRYQDQIKRRSGQAPNISVLETRGHSRRPSKSNSLASEDATRRRERKYLAEGLTAPRRRDSIASRSESHQSYTSQLYAEIDGVRVPVPDGYAASQDEDGGLIWIPLNKPKARETQYHSSTSSNTARADCNGEGPSVNRSASVRSPVIS